MRTIYIIAFFFIGCTAFQTDDRPQESPAPVDINAEVAALKLTVTKMETQVAALKKNDSIYNLRVNSEITKLKALSYKFSSDSFYQWKAIKSATPLSVFIKDSTYQWGAIRKLQAVPSLSPKLNLLYTNHIKDSLNQWVQIKKLQATAPVTQIPVIQADITAIKSKNLAQDKTLTSTVSEIGNVRVKNDSLQNLITKYAKKLDSTQFKITGDMVTIPGLTTLQTRVTSLEGKLMPKP